MADRRPAGTGRLGNFETNATICVGLREPEDWPAATICRSAAAEGGPLPVRRRLTQLPTRNGVWILRNAARTDSAVIRPVLGFSEGMFSIETVNRAESLSISMVWQFRSTDGSAQISIEVRSAPMPASDRAAATLTLAGNPAAAS